MSTIVWLLWAVLGFVSAPASAWLAHKLRPSSKWLSSAIYIMMIAGLAATALWCEHGVLNAYEAGKVCVKQERDTDEVDFRCTDWRWP